MTDATIPVIELKGVSKSYGNHLALSDIDVAIHPGEVHCLLGDNGAGKSTLIMSVARNFFLGTEPTRGWGPFKRIDFQAANRIAIQKIQAMGIRRVTDPDQLVGTMSGGERQALAVARALHFGAKVLILDEPTAALGVRESAVVIDLIRAARSQGIALVLITHNATHASAVGNRYTVLWHGRVAASFKRGERTQEDLVALMAGGAEDRRGCLNACGADRVSSMTGPELWW